MSEDKKKHGCGCGCDCGHNHDHEEGEFITLEFDDGTEECEVLGTFEVDGKEYIALVPLEAEDEAYLYGYREIPENSDEDEVEFELLDIEDDEEFEKVLKVFESLTLEEEEEEEE